jgi:hypothetical protein
VDPNQKVSKYSSKHKESQSSKISIRRLEKMAGAETSGVREGPGGIGYPSKVREFFIDSFKSHLMCCMCEGWGDEGKRRRKEGDK